MNIGFCGYSAKKFDVEQAKQIISGIFAQELKENPGFTVVSGGTDLGIPKLVYEEADKHGLPTVGVICSQGQNEELHPGTKIIVRGQNWGDESNYFLSIIDKLYRIGGGNQSQEEAEIAKLKGIPVVEYELPEIK